MVIPSRRPQSQAGGVTTTKSLLTWTLLLLSAAGSQAKFEQYIRPLSDHGSATADVARAESYQPKAGRSPAEIPLLKREIHTVNLKKTQETEYNDVKRYNSVPAPARDLSAVRAPSGQPVESSGLTAISEARPLSDWEADDIILLSTIDGALHARDRRTGSKRWTLYMPDEPMIQATRHARERTDPDDDTPDIDYMFIVEPSQDGQLYAQFADPGMGLMRLPASVKKMATESPVSMQFGGEYLTTSSSQQSKAYTIDATTGEILYEFPKQGGGGRSEPQPRCRRRNDLELEDPACKPGRQIRLGRNVYTFTISNERTEQDVYTIRFSEWVTNRNDNGLQQQYVQSLDDLDIQNGCNGRITGLDLSDKSRPIPRFTQLLDSPVARVFDVIRPRDSRDDSMDLVLLSRPTDLSFTNAMYQDWREMRQQSQQVFINKTEAGYWYALSEQSYPGVTTAANYSEVSKNRNLGPLDLNGDLHEIIGLNVLTNEPGGRAPPPAPIRLTISDVPENDNKNVVDDEKQMMTQEPGQPPSVTSPKVDTRGWSTGLMGVVLGGLIMLLLNSKLNITGNKQLQTVLAPRSGYVVTGGVHGPPTSGKDKVLTEEPTRNVSTVEVPQSINIDGIKISDVATPAHSRGPSSASVDSPKKKSVRIGDTEENNSSEAESDEEDGNNDSTEGNADSATQGNAPDAQPRRPKTKRGKRGGRKNNKKKKSMDPAVFDEKPTISIEQHLDNGMVQIGRLKVDISEEKCLGRGSNGTAVYPGILDGREVAVKRLIKSANNLAEKEIKHLVSSDENQHVIRYFGKEESRDFFYIALDQFTTSLDQFIEHPEKFPALVDQAKGFDVKDCLRQITDGVQHLHSLKLVHRDIKPQNVLVRAIKSNRPTTGMPKLQFVISDFGLCKPLEDGAMSTFAPTANHTAAGTTGWRAPELLVSPRDAIAAPNAESSTSRTVSTTHSMDGTTIDLPTGRRATKAIDIFSLGCVFYYVMTRGGHPFDVGGSSLGRDLNIKENNYTTELMRFHKYEYDAEDLIMQMVNHEPKNRPDTSGVLKHPYFWTQEQKLEFVCLVSDCYEREKNSITDLHAKGPVTRTPAEEESLAELCALEALGPNVIGVNSKKETRDFLQALPRTFLNGMGKQRSYTGTKMIDLLRLIRNKKNHFRDLPEDVQSLIVARGPSLEEGYYAFWTDRFPALLINCHANILERQLVEKFRLERWYN